MNLMEWVRTNYGVIGLGVIVLIMFGYHYFKQYKKKKAEQPTSPEGDALQEPILLEMDLFGDITGRDTLGTFRKQKSSVEKGLVQIKQEAKRVVGAEKKLDYEYRQQKIQFANERKRMGLNYTNYMNQHRILDEMIQNQLRMQEEFKKAKGRK